MRLRNKADSGMVLMIVLWFLVLLVILAAGLSRRGHVNTALSRLSVGQLRAQHMAFSALRYAQALIARDTRDETGGPLDTVYQCGFALKEGSTPEKLFAHVTFPQGSFDIVNSFQRKDGAKRWGFSDEESRINLNAVSAANYKVLQYLLMDAGVEEEAALDVAAGAVDWVDQDDTPFLEGYGRENSPSQTGGIRVKNAPFQSLEELLLIKGMTPEIFESVKDDLTVFPSRSALLLNISTATPRALRALARNFTGVATNTEISDADFLAEKIIALRRGPDGIDGTDDDRPIDNRDLRLNTRETALMAQIEGARTNVSLFLRLGIRAVDEHSKVTSLLEAVISRSDGKIVYWQRIR